MSQDSTTSQQAVVIDAIESVIEEMLEQLAKPDGRLIIALKAQSNSKGNRNHFLNLETGALEVPMRVHDKVLSFPGESSEDVSRFTIFLRVLDLIHEAIVSGVVTTKRDIYYKDPELFQNQRTVDSCVDDLAVHFGVTRSALNVTAAAKGLVAGCFDIIWKTGDETHVQDEADGMVVPNANDVAFVSMQVISWILVVEKEATFRTLTSRKFHLNGPYRGILLTAKGYPDLSSRAFLRLLSESSINEPTPLPIYVLVDADPDGLAIMSMFKYGSIKVSHENAALVIPRLQWLGVKTSDITSHSDIASIESGLLPMTARDRRRASNMLDSPVFAEDGPELEWRRELQIMLVMGFKAEMQILGEGEGHLLEYLKRRMGELEEVDEMLLDYESGLNGSVDGAWWMAEY